jgi:hypothetical protein
MEVLILDGQLSSSCQKVELADFKRVVLLIDQAQHALYELIIAIARPDRAGS